MAPLALGGRRPPGRRTGRPSSLSAPTSGRCIRRCIRAIPTRVAWAAAHTWPPRLGRGLRCAPRWACAPTLGSSCPGQRLLAVPGSSVARGAVRTPARVGPCWSTAGASARPGPCPGMDGSSIRMRRHTGRWRPGPQAGCAVAGAQGRGDIPTDAHAHALLGPRRPRAADRHRCAPRLALWGSGREHTPNHHK